MLPYIDRSKISDQQLQDLVMEHVLMEREQALRDMMRDDEESGLYDAPPDWPWETRTSL